MAKRIQKVIWRSLETIIFSCDRESEGNGIIVYMKVGLSIGIDKERKRSSS